jgi:hypothetical protein
MEKEWQRYQFVLFYDELDKIYQKFRELNEFLMCKFSNEHIEYVRSKKKAA